MDVTKLIGAEIGLINKMLQAHQIQVRALQKQTMVVKSSFIVYGLQVAPGESVRKVEAIQRELSNELTRQRVRLLSGYAGRVVVRLRDYPLAIEVPHPAPSLLSGQAANLRTGRFMALIGRSYSYTGAKEEYLDLERHYHTLIAAMSGGGKSTLMRMALLTLTYNTSPVDLRLLLVDMKNDDLVPFQKLPHCLRYAGDPDSAAAAIDYVYAVKTERIASQDKPFRLLMVIDELAELGVNRETLRQLGSILSTGRSLGINVWAGTQYPSAAAIGSIVSASFTTRLVGMVDGKTSALVATKRAGSGAEHLVTPGDFLRVDGQDLVRMKSYHISQSDTDGLIAHIARRWAGKGEQVAPTPNPTLATVRHDEIDTIVDAIAELYAQGASKNAMCKHALGKAYAGGYATKIDAAIARLQASTASSTVGSTKLLLPSTHTSVEGFGVSSSRSDEKILKFKRAS